MIRSLLWTKDKRPESGGETIETTITSTPFHRDVRTTFPFLVSESKSEKAGVPQSEVESQMAFAVRSLLLVQENLRKAAGKDSRWMSGPLVWCVSHRGEEWQISAAFIKYRGNIEQFVGKCLGLGVFQLTLSSILWISGTERLQLTMEPYALSSFWITYSIGLEMCTARR